MTLPYERYRAVRITREFLADLLDSAKTPRVPRSVRQTAARCLKHFPAEHDMERAAGTCPDTFATEWPTWDQTGKELR
jgi:hypothetical protein